MMGMVELSNPIMKYKGENKEMSKKNSKNSSLKKSKRKTKSKYDKPIYTILGIVFIIAVLIGGLYFFNNKLDEAKSQADSETTYITDPIGDERLLIYVGEEEAENEILLTFDYSCPYCHEWAMTIFPQFSSFIEEGLVKFRTQPMVYVDANSLLLAKIDQNIRLNYSPDQYFNMFFELMSELNQDVSVDDTFINDLIMKHDFDKTIALGEPELDVINVTRKYTRQLNIESVPTIFVNGKKVENAFSLEEIKSYFK